MTTSDSLPKNVLLGGLEGGGTKFVCAVGTGPGDIRDEIRFPTTTPEETLARAIAFFRQHKPAAIGIASFGPVDLNPASPSFGFITTTPKPGWAHTDVLGAFRRAFDLPLAFELDVNAAAIGEYTWVPENRALNSLVYYTIGTGIGAGVIVSGQIIHGLTHPEAGHVRLPHDWSRDPFAGICPFHGDCFEGLASGPALAARWGQAADSLPQEHVAWDLEAGYIAAALVNTILLLSPQRIVLGGGVMQQDHLFPLIRQKVKALLNGYVASPLFEGDLSGYIVPPSLGNRSGVLGALAIAQRLIQS
ncbi:MAG: ROK family protein [Anaerolineales bacterium]|nr:ROK family protein [Anaerolineales bacterium]MCX7609574.1 ROK family protein [Anaerolineales bacterium]